MTTEHQWVRLDITKEQSLISNAILFQTNPKMINFLHIIRKTFG